ncbi:uncharacterized protein LOC135369020 isoform X4 [Ornithodoros turicata]|uniref:uncharacterized protein LOC135369020 isoform X4 n=1 Tax=Ornithodoros turicata TaxID=34597 RepID=UPI003139EEAE
MDYYQEVPQQFSEMSGLNEESALPIQSSVSVIQTQDESRSRKTTLIFFAICLLLFLSLLIGIVIYVTTTSKKGDVTQETQEPGTYAFNPPAPQYQSSTSLKPAKSPTAASTTPTTYKPQIPSSQVQHYLPPLLCETSIGNALTVGELTPYCDFFIVDFDFKASTHPQYNYILKVELHEGDKMEEFMNKKAGLASKVVVGLPYNSVRDLNLKDDAQRTALARGISQVLLDEKLDGVMLYHDELSDADASKAKSMLLSMTTEYNGGYYTLFKFKISNIAARPKIQEFLWRASQMDAVFVVIETLSKIMPNPLLPNTFCESRESNYSILCRLGANDAEGIGWSLGTVMYTDAVNKKWKDVHFFESDYTLATKGEKIMSYLLDESVDSFIVLYGFENDLMDNYTDCSRPMFAYTSALQGKVGPIASRMHQG